MSRAHKTITVLTAAATLCGGLLISGPAIASAADGAKDAVTSSRSFTPGNQVRVNLLAESTSVSVDENTDWGGIGSMDVPQTKSQAEKDAEARQEAQKKAEEDRQRLLVRQAQPARTEGQLPSRSEARDQVRQEPVAKEAPVSGNAQAVLDYALQYLGVPYAFGGTSPESGFDCSGFTQYVFAHFGIGLPRTSQDQASAGVAVSQPAPGDLMISADNGHVAIYMGNGLMIHAPRPGKTVCQQKIYGTGWTYRRLL